ncbi:MAG: DPP IV N-terminal domain-containing protein, partial [Anaerolineae bacterium]|nr:DPP IV N-terminal domain-containing protein [Anaerolineae bacterium]
MSNSKIYFLTIITLFSLLSPMTAQAQDQPRAERIAVAAYRNGQWDIYSISPDPDAPRPKQLTRDAFEDTDPAYSPDGTRLAYASRRDRNWDVYVLDLQTGRETRLTDSPHYDGAPSWSPDGQFIA